jgi:FkbM family methyltransferase
MSTGINYKEILCFAKKGFRRLQAELFPSAHQLTLRQWFADDGEYTLRFDYELDEDSIVFDLGGYQGQWASDLYARYRCRIYLFEPVSSFAERIRLRFKRNEHIQVYQVALGGTTRREIIHVTADASSMFGRSGRGEPIEIIDVSEWFSKNPVTRIHLMKINIEGGEYELLDRLIETGLVEIIDNIQVQFHGFVKGDQERMERIQNALQKTHEPTYQYKFVWENWRRKKN